MSTSSRYTLIVCRGPECGDKRDSAVLHAEIERLIRERGLGDRINLAWQSCFGKCQSGPNILVREESLTRGAATFAVYLPGATGDAVLYTAVQKHELGRILEEHILGGRPIRWMLHRQPKGVAR